MNTGAYLSIVNFSPGHELPTTLHVDCAGLRIADLPSEEVEHTGVSLCGTIILNSLHGTCRAEVLILYRSGGFVDHT